MRKLLFIIPIFVSLSLSAQIDFFHGTFEEALAKSKAEGKLIFMDCFTTWCGPCKKMSSETFQNKEVGEYFNANFINMKVDMEKGEGPTLSQKFSITAYPTLLFIDSNGKLAKKEMGYMDKDKFINVGKAAIKLNDRSGKYKELYEKGDKSDTNLRNYAYSLIQSSLDYQKIANEYIKNQKDLKTTENLQFIFDFANYADSKIFDLLIEYKKDILPIKNGDLFEQKVRTACLNTAKRAAEFKSEDLLKEAKTKGKKNSSNKTISEEIDVVYYKASEDEVNYLKACDNLVKKSNDPIRIYSLTQDVYSAGLKDKAGLSAKAEGWAKKAANLGNTYDYWLYYGSILNANKKKDEAKTALNKAIERAKIEEKSPSAAEQLLKRL